MQSLGNIVHSDNRHVTAWLRGATSRDARRFRFGKLSSFPDSFGHPAHRQLADIKFS
jgi:hypothetical protein